MTSGPRLNFPTLRSPAFDLAFIAAPGLLPLMLVLGLAAAGLEHAETPAWAFLLVVVGVDVAHVWSTLFRVYLDPVERRRRPWAYFGIPAAIAFVSLLLVAVEPLWFWRVLAYVAVHHFIKQQVGFVMLYRHAAGERDLTTRRLDQAAVWVGTAVPVLDWHTSPRAFHWFIEGDFAGPLDPAVMQLAWPLYGLTALLWLGSRLRGPRNPLKDLVMATTWANWFVGIVLLDGDLIYTLTNVLLHGVPYLALVWHVTERRVHEPDLVAPLLSRLGGRAVTFLALVLALAFAEELLWDGLVWREHGAWFLNAQDWLPSGETVTLLAIPLLSVPQATHYVLDGLIWRMDGSNPGLRSRLFSDAGPIRASSPPAPPAPAPP
ncbi:MAG: hypothetical protein IV100_01470 [Myxococcales bacterium]|nr:hypothetical protein [Myxococcales bacterium]